MHIGHGSAPENQQQQRTTTRNGFFLFSSFARSLSCRLFFSSPQPSFSSPPFFFFLLSFSPLPPSFPLKYSLLPPKYSLLSPLSLLMYVTARNARALFHFFVAGACARARSPPHHHPVFLLAGVEGYRLQDVMAKARDRKWADISRIRPCDGLNGAVAAPGASPLPP